MSELKDRDNDGVPDVIEDAIEEARDIKNRFGMKTILITMLVGLVVAGYGLFGFFYMDLRGKYIDLQAQYNYEEARWELEEKYKMIEERDRLIAELEKKQSELDAIYEKARIARIKAEEELKKKEYKEKNYDEANKLDADGLLNRFNGFGISANKRTR